MILGKIVGKTSTTDFQFSVSGDVDKFEYVQVLDKSDNYILCQVIELEKDRDKSIAFCNVIGYRDKENRLRGLGAPLAPGTEVLYADDKFVKETLGLGKAKNAAFIGTLEGRENVQIFLDINKLLTKHVAVLAKTGAGKCVSPETKITLSDGGQVEIGHFVDKKLSVSCKEKDGVEFIENNDADLKVISLGERNKISSSKIVSFMRRKAPKFMYSVVTKSGQEVKLTPEHPVPILRKGGILWVPVCELDNQDYVLLPKLDYIKGSKQEIDILDLWADSNQVRVDDKRVLKFVLSKIKEKKVSIESLSKELGFSINAIRGWFYRSGLPLKQLIKLCRVLGVNFKDLRKDIILLRYKQNTLPSRIEVSRDLAKLLGYMLAEGHNNSKTIGFTNCSKDIQKDYSLLVQKIFGVKACKISDDNVLLVYNTFLAKTLTNLGFTNSSWTKFVCEKILSSERPVLYAFLSSFIDCDGHVCKDRPSIEVCLASKRLIQDIRLIFLRLGIVPRLNKKIVKGSEYQKLTVNGASYFSLLEGNLNFLIAHKKQRLREHSLLDPNTNIDTVPNINEIIEHLITLLRMNRATLGASSISKYVNNKGNPSFNRLKAMVACFKEEHESLKRTYYEISDLFAKLPRIDEDYALSIIQDAHIQGLNFCDITRNTSISSTTARRMVLGLTRPTNNAYVLAKNVLTEKKDKRINEVLSLNLKDVVAKISYFCGKIGYEQKGLCKGVGYCKNFLYENRTKNTNILYSDVYALTKELFGISTRLNHDLSEAERDINYLESLAYSNLFFDQIGIIKKIKSDCKYVYDLETEDHNFIANNIVIHNSYVVGVLLEELLENKIPIVIIDPHGEYSTLKYPNDENLDKLKKLDLKAKGYPSQVQEFSPDVQTNPECKPLKISNKDLSPVELIHMLPAKLSNAQLGILYSSLKNIGNKADFDELLLELENEDSSVKWTLINILEYVKKTGLFSDAPTPLFELVKTGKASIINLKGVNPEVQEVVVYKIVKDLFTERKKGNIPPFFLVIEEGHNFIPERTYGESKSSGVLRQIFSEGRKFGLGVCIVSQRPSRVEKNALSQVNTQIILKVTNPNDVKSISSSVEGLTAETEKEIKNITIGTALITGVVDLPIFVNIRPRRSKHGGASVKILSEEAEEERDFVSEAKKGKGELLPLIKQKVSLKDLKLMGKKDVKTVLVPCVFLSCSDKQGDFNLLINLNNGHVITDLESGTGVQLKGLNLDNLSPQQKKVMKIAFELKEFRPAEIFSKSGLQFSDLYETIKFMTDKGFFTKSGDKYVLSEKISLLTNIHDNSFYGKVEYSNLDFDEQLDKKVDVSSLIDFLGRFLTIKNEKECWLVVYKE